MAALKAGHVFISYVREDAEMVDRLQTVIEAAGVPVWRDTDDLWAGEDWRMKIREAITDNALVFIACFSDNSSAKEKTYQREEVLLAVEQLRQRAPEQAWLIPIRLSDCSLPQYDLGAGRTLDSLQRVDLIGEQWDAGIARLVSGILRTLQPTARAPVDPTDSDPQIVSRVKAMLLDDSSQIQLEETVRTAANQAHEALSDRSTFPSRSDRLTNNADGERFLLEQASRYWDSLSDLRDALLVGCAWGQQRHGTIWTKATERIANTAVNESGQTALIELRRYPTVVLVYAGGIAAVHRGNYDALKALTIDAQFRGDQVPVPVVGVSHVWLPFGHNETTAQLLALQSSGEDITDELVDGIKTGRRGKRHTPVSDHLHDALRCPARVVIDDDGDYTATFDRLEVLLALLASDAKSQAEGTGGYVWGPWYGSFTWRSRYSAKHLEELIHDEFQQARERWEPLQAGLFGGLVARAEAAFMEVLVESQQARKGRW